MTSTKVVEVYSGSLVRVMGSLPQSLTQSIQDAPKDITIVVIDFEDDQKYEVEFDDVAVDNSTKQEFWSKLHNLNIDLVISKTIGVEPYGDIPLLDNLGKYCKFICRS